MRSKAFLFFVLMTSYSCGEKIFTGDVNCDECYEDRPDHVYLEINATLNGEFPAVPFVVFRGNVEDNQIEFADTIYESPFYLYVEADNRYSVKAEYKRDDATLYAIDGTKPKVLHVSDVCETNCYIVENTALDVRINKQFLNY